MSDMTLAGLWERNEAALALHTNGQVCQSHHVTISDSHNCGGAVIYRCFTCRVTGRTPCRTWQALTGKEKPDGLPN